MMPDTEPQIVVPCHECGNILSYEQRRHMALHGLEKVQGIIFGLLSVRWPLSDETKDSLIAIHTEIRALYEKERAL